MQWTSQRVLKDSDTINIYCANLGYSLIMVDLTGVNSLDTMHSHAASRFQGEGQTPEHTF